MKKKIGLLTMPLIDNYGGIIQITALYHFLNTNGFNAYLIDKKYNLPFYKVIIKMILSHNPLYKVYDVNNYTTRRLYLENISNFIETEFKNKTKEIFNLSDLIHKCKPFDTIVVGSDQVWRYEYIKKDLDIYFLDFVANNQKKISYAASFGVDFWEGNQASKESVTNYLKTFDAISVREDSGIKIVNEIFSTEAVQVLDPTFLPDVSFYNGLIDKEKFEFKVELFNYVLDSSPDKKEFINTISEKINKSIKIIDLQENLNTSKKKQSIAEWLYHFQQAEFIVTDSFHGMVFSIIFNKQFIAIANSSRGITRFTSLLKLLNLEHRLITDIKLLDIIDEIIDNPIDFNFVNKDLEKFRNQSKKFLFDNI